MPPRRHSTTATTSTCRRFACTWTCRDRCTDRPLTGLPHGGFEREARRGHPGRAEPGLPVCKTQRGARRSDAGHVGSWCRGTRQRTARPGAAAAQDGGARRDCAAPEVKRVSYQRLQWPPTDTGRESRRRGGGERAEGAVSRPRPPPRRYSWARLGPEPEGRRQAVGGRESLLQVVVERRAASRTARSGDQSRRPRAVLRCPGVLLTGA